ncbi:MAG: hypothetical protein KAI22_00560 [Gammaproteobacteria bacterium]|nr:hypothetical protein [Gammaproteobacteria bacterium]
MSRLKTLFFLLLFLSPAVFAAPYEVGDKLQTFSLSDQHEKLSHINNETRIILFSRDKAGGQLITEALSGIGKEYLIKQHIVYITDISGMPGLISKYVAIPSMRKKSFPILLDKEGQMTAQFPDKDNTATLIFVESLNIKNIKHLQSAEEIQQSLKFKQNN